MKILFTGGGTGGHIFPIVAIAENIKKINPDSKIRFIGPKDDIGLNTFRQYNIKTKRIISGKIRRYFGFIPVFHNFIDIFFKIPIGIIQSFLYIFFFSPDLMFSKGGYGSVPSMIAARILKVPIFIHESDIAPGITNRRSSNVALEIFTSFPETEFFPKEKMILVGNPIREVLLKEPLKADGIFENLEKDRPIILIMGGSQGSSRINDIILESLPMILSRFQVIHQCGQNNYKKVLSESNFFVSEKLKKSYHLFPFLTGEQLQSAYKISDLIVSRAGSGSIFEIAAFKKPSILIPLSESAQNHQFKNAHNYSKFGCAIVIEEQNLTSHFFYEKIVSIIDNENLKESMKNSAEIFSRPRSAKIIAEYIVEFLNQK
jgi:UDP-N-acetylglucosamine--N-acetylmuramyl-(pentapeptide) pyrophosphoryl-undecaprenol N-acetylglucosamine transferase